MTAAHRTKRKTSFSEDVWEILKLPVDGRQLLQAHCIPSDQRQRQFQLFEVLTVETLHRLCAGLTWEATPIGHDFGADFIGRGKTVRIDALGLEMQWVVIGQVKRHRKFKLPSLVQELKKLGQWNQRRRGKRHDAPISAAIFVLAADDPEIASKAQEYFSDPYNSIYFTAAKYVVDARRLIAYWKNDRGFLRSLLDEAITPEQISTIETELDSVDPDYDPHLNVELSVPREASAGKPIRITATIRSELPLPSLSFRLRHRRSESESEAIEVLRPSSLSHGTEYRVDGTDVRLVELWMRVRAPGQRSLGSLDVIDERGVSCASYDLGTIRIAPSFEPPFFREPLLDLERVAERKIREVAAGAIAPISVTGAGGGGKSRFCERVVDMAADAGFAWVSVRQDNSPVRGRNLLREVMARLCPVRAGSAFTTDDLLTQLRRTMSPVAAEMMTALRTFVDSDNGEIDVTQTAAALTALLVGVTRQTPLILHLHDLHWASAETFTILRLVIQYLRYSERALQKGILILLEGRNREALRQDTNTYRPPEEWLRFLAGAGLEDWALRSWTHEETETFLRTNLESLPIDTKSIDPNDIPLHEELIHYVLDHASGNPMHVQEQLRWMHDLGIVQQDERGLIYVVRRLPPDLATPGAVEDVIRERLAFYRDKAPRLIDTLALFARLGRGVVRELYEYVAREPYAQLDRAMLQELDVLPPPSRDDATVEFRHENYFHVFRDEPIAADPKLLDLLVRWYRGQPFEPTQGAELVTLLFLYAEPSYASIASLAAEVLAIARTAEDGELTQRMIRALLRVPPGHAAAADIDSIALRYELALVLTTVGTSGDSLQQLRDVVAATVHRRGVSHAFLYWVRAKAEMANIYVSLQMPDEAIRAVDDALPVTEAYLARPDRDVALDTSLRREIVKMWHRKALALWFDGRYVAAAPLQRRALCLARDAGDESELSVTIRELGALFYHRALPLGIRLMQRALEMSLRIPEISFGWISLAEAHILAGKLMASAEEGDRTAMGTLLREARALHYRCLKRYTVYEAMFAALHAGAAAGWLKDLDEAHLWFRTAVAMAIQGELEDEIWKARVNLAQVCFEMGRHAEAEMHAREAAAVIRKGLDWKPQNRAARRSLMTLPLMHVIRTGGATESDVAPYLNSPVPPYAKRWETRPPARSRAREAQQVLHVRARDSDYFLLN